MEKNKARVIELLEEATKRSKEECILINDVLDDHFIIGRNNKDKIVKDFSERLKISLEEADKLYNTCAEVLVKNIFKRK